MALSAPGSAFDDITENPDSPYYIGPVTSEVASGDDIRAEVTRQVDDQIAHGWLGDVVTPLARDKEIQKRYEQQLAQSRKSLDEGLQIRENGAAPSTVWDNATHEQMQTAISQNADSAAIAVTSEEWVRLGNELTEHQQNLAGAISDSLSDWQGSGGDAARQHLAAVGQWLGTTAKGATLTGRQQEIHSQALNETQKQMAANPPVQFDTQAANAHLQTITDPVVYAQQAQIDQTALQQQEAGRQQAARIMTQYDDTVGSATTTPAFPAPPKLAGRSATTATLPSGSASTASSSATDAANQAALQSGSAGTAGAGQPGLTASGAGMPGGLDTTGAGMPGGLAAASAGAGGVSSGTANVPGLQSGAYSADGAPLAASASGGGSVNTPELSSVDYPSGSSSSGSSYSGGSSSGGSSFSGSVPSIPDSTLPSSVTGTDLSSTSGGSTRMPTIGYSGGVNGDSIASRLGGTATPTGNPLSGLDSLGGTGGISGSSLGGGSGSSGLKGGAGSVKGVSGLGTGESAAGVKGLGGGGAAAGGSKLSGGASSGAAAAAEEAAAGRSAAGAAGAAGRSGTPGTGMGGGGRGKGEEDKEHRVADYLEGDPDFFEGEQVVAPPVIGDWKKSKEAKKK